MSAYRIVTVDSTNVEEQGFFCYKSKKKQRVITANRPGSRNARTRVLYEGKRSVSLSRQLGRGSGHRGE